jgi:hypothetical protein
MQRKYFYINLLKTATFAKNREKIAIGEKVQKEIVDS